MDIDLDFSDRNQILQLIEHTPAILENGTKHPTGIYLTAIPQNPISGFASLDYKKAEEFGYFKIDFLNNSVYKLIKSPAHLEELLAKKVNWKRLLDKEFVSKLVHIGNYADMIKKLTEPIDSIEKLAMFINLIRPGKKHLQGLPWNIVEKTIWNKTSEEGYSFKKAHSYAYAILILLHISILEELENKNVNE
jgi:hypothetical protein